MHNVFLLALLFAIARLIYIASGVVGLSPDEAQYWHWLTRPELSYVTKPPLTTWLMGVSTSIFGDTYLGVRFFAALGHATASILAFGIAAQVHSRRAGWWAFWAFQVTPLFAIGGILMVTDVPALVFWLAAIYMLTTLNWKQKNWPQWLLIGVFIGLAGLSKYTAVFFYPLLGVYLLWQQRGYLVKPQIYTAGFMSLALQTPVLYWNYTYNWLGLKHVIGQTNGGTSLNDAWQNLGDFLAGQAGVLGIVAFLGMLAFWFNPRECSPKLKILWAFTAPLFVFFVWQAVTGKVQANWPILATSVSLIAVCTCLGTHQSRVVRMVFAVSLMLNATLTLFLHNTNMLRTVGINLPHKIDPSKDLRGWQDVTKTTLARLKTLPPHSNPYIITTRYRSMAEISFELARAGRTDIQVIYVNSGSHRLSQYDLWPWPNLAGRTAVIVRTSQGLPAHIKNAFTTCTPQPPTNLHPRSAHLTTCAGYKNLTKIIPTTH